MKLHLIRHGESTWNKQGLVQGIRDPELSPNGKKQAQLLTKRLRHYKFEAFYSSPLKRAYQTAEALNEAHSLPIIIEKDLHEIRLGEWESKSISELRNQDSEMVDKWYKMPLEVKIPGAETVNEFKDRVVNVFTTILSKHPQDKEEIIIVTHGGVISIYVGWLLEMNLNKVWSISLKNCSLTTIEFCGDATGNSLTNISLFNDTCHLESVSKSLITW